MNKKLKLLVIPILFITFTNNAYAGAVEDYDAGKVAYGIHDYEKALTYFKKAAEQGHIRAQSKLGLMYELGQGALKNHEEAIQWYAKAGEQGDADAQFNVGWMYDYGEGISKSHEEAIKWYLRAAKQGQASAQFNLGVKYYKGQGVAKNRAEAYAWISIAANRGAMNGDDAVKTMEQRLDADVIIKGKDRARELLNQMVYSNH